MHQRAKCAICIQLVAVLGAWTQRQALMQPAVGSCASASSFSSAAEILANEARGNNASGVRQNHAVPPSATVSSAGKGVTDWLSNAATAVSDAISAAATQTSRKSKIARSETGETASKTSPERSDAEKIDAEYVQNMVSSGLGAAMKVMGEATHQRFRKLEAEIAEVKDVLLNLTQAVKQTETHDKEIKDLRTRHLEIEKTDANRQIDCERVRQEQLQTLNEIRQIAEQAKISAANLTASPPGHLPQHARSNFAASSASTTAPGASTVPHEMRTEGILAGLGDGLSNDDIIARANDVLRRAGVAESTHAGLSSNVRGTAVFICFKEPGLLRLAADKIRRLNASFDGRRVWLDARRTRAENKPVRAIHRAAEALRDLLASLQAQGVQTPFQAEDLTKNMRKLSLQNKLNGPIVCWWNVRLQELTFSAECIQSFKNLGRDSDLDQISAWCSLE